MSLSDREVRALKATDKRQKKSVGDSLFVVIESVGKGGGKSFFGRTRFPPGRAGKDVEVRIGRYGTGVGGDGLSAQHGRNGTTSGRGAERQAETPENSREGKEALMARKDPQRRFRTP